MSLSQKQHRVDAIKQFYLFTVPIVIPLIEKKEKCEDHQKG